MKLTLANLQQLMQYLRNTAEVDPNDVVSNQASSLAARLERAGASTFDMSLDFNDWSQVDQTIAKYAILKRNEYVLLPMRRLAVRVTDE